MKTSKEQIFSVSLCKFAHAHTHTANGVMTLMIKLKELAADFFPGLGLNSTDVPDIVVC